MTGVSRGQRGHKLREPRGLGSPASSKVRAAPCGPGRGPEGQRSLLPERLWSQTPCRLQGAAGQGPTAAAAGERPGSARPPLGSRLHLLRAQAEGSNARSAYFTPSSAIESVLVTTTQKTLWTRGGGHTSPPSSVLSCSHSPSVTEKEGGHSTPVGKHVPSEQTPRGGGANTQVQEEEGNTSAFQQVLRVLGAPPEPFTAETCEMHLDACIYNILETASYSCLRSARKSLDVNLTAPRFPVTPQRLRLSVKRLRRQRPCQEALLPTGWVPPAASCLERPSPRLQSNSGETIPFPLQTKSRPLRDKYIFLRR